ncbi:MAG: DUF2617 family protein [Planctomycetota bacterium]
MESHPTDIAVSNLAFYLYQRALHPELFKIYSRRQLKTGRYEASLWLTGGSHVVSVYTDGLCLTELIGGSKQILPQRGLIERFSFTGQRSHKFTLSKGLSYLTDFQVEKMSPGLYHQSHLDLEKFAYNRGVFVKFPQRAVGGLQPFSYVDFEARQKELHVHAFHAYPDEVTIIKTQSLFEFH